jgi:hypothetical protein
MLLSTPQKPFHNPKRPKPSFFSLQSCEMDRDKQKSRELLETSEINASFSKPAQPSYKQHTEETEKCRARYVQTPQQKEEDEERWLPEAQTLKHQQNPSG